MIENPKAQTFDLIVIGAGSGGLNVAGFMNRAEFRVLIIDKSDANIGGDCLNFGCVPSKALIHVARLVQDAKKAETFGLRQEGKVDIQKVLAYVKEKQAIFRKHEDATYFRSLGMAVALGEGRFSGPQSVTVNGIEYQGKRIVLATGSRPRELRIPGIETVTVYTNESVFNIKELPKRFLFIGGGPISVELGQAFSAFGSQVTIIHSGDRILSKEDPEVSHFMEAALRKEGIEIILNAEAKAISEGELIVTVKNEGERHLPLDALFSGIGRILNVEGLDLDKAGIALSADGQKLILDQYLRTTNKNVLAVGDIVGQHMFTHAAETHAALVIANLFSPFKKSLQPERMAWVTYTNPEVATFGLSQDYLKKEKIRYESLSVPLTEDDRAIVDQSNGFIKLLVGKKGRVLGGTLVAPQAGEIVGELILAETKKLTVQDLFSRIAPYPTAARIIRRAAGVYLSRKLTARVKKLLHFLYSF